MAEADPTPVFPRRELGDKQTKVAGKSLIQTRHVYVLGSLPS